MDLLSSYQKMLMDRVGFIALSLRLDHTSADIQWRSFGFDFNT